jgi:hypothetical protein
LQSSDAGSQSVPDCHFERLFSDRLQLSGYIAQHLMSNNAPPGCRTPSGRANGQELHFDVKARFVAPISVIFGIGRSTL